MAITILQEPTSYNVTGTPLVYTLSSSNQNEPQFRYITDIYEQGSSTMLTRLVNNKNLSGNTNINVSSILNDYLDYDYNFKTSLSGFTNNSKNFTIEFGEQYGTTLTSPITNYTASATDTLFYISKGQLDYSQNYQKDGFNWDYTVGDPTGYILSNSPATQSFSPDEYLTLSFIDTEATVNYYETGSLAYTRTIDSPLYFTLGISPLNFNTEPIIQNADVITVEVNSGSISKRYELDTDCRDDSLRIAFINKYATWDYYTIHNPVRRLTQIDKEFYEISSTKLNEQQTTFDVSNRGITQYFTDYRDEYEITTDSLTATESQWLRELFTSTEVFIQSGTDMIPINILNTSETIINTTARNKNYQYTIRYQYANIREPR